MSIKITPAVFLLQLVLQSTNGFQETTTTSTLAKPDEYSNSNFVLSSAGFIAGDGFCQCGRPTHRYLATLNQHTFSAIQNDIPWTATFVRNVDKEIFCTGVLLNNLYILTAGHCVSRIKPNQMRVVLNEDSFLPNDETIRTLPKYNVSQIAIHPKYNSATQRHDIALIKLNSPINFFEKLLNPVCIPVKNDEYYKKYNGTVTSWGAFDSLDDRTKVVNGSFTTPKLQVKLNLPLISNLQCNTETTHKGMISEDMLCAGFLTDTETCKGDSGGPMTIKRKDRHYLVGIASWGDGCAFAYTPSVYTRVGSYIGWILRNTADAEWCVD